MGMDYLLPTRPQRLFFSLQMTCKNLFVFVFLYPEYHVNVVYSKLKKNEKIYFLNFTSQNHFKEYC